MSPTILVVDDNLSTRKSFRASLEHEAYSVIEAHDAKSALRYLRQASPDLIIQDLILPDMDGIELTRRFRESPQGASVPILGLSGFMGQTDEARAIAAGFNGLLVKPIEPSRLVEAVSAYLLERQARSLRHRPPQPAPDRRPIALKLTRRQLEHQVKTQIGLAQRCTLQATQLALLGGVSRALARGGDIESILRDTLATCLDGVGISKHALYLRERSGELKLRHAIGYSHQDWTELERFFGHLTALEEALAAEEVIAISSRSKRNWAAFLSKAGVATCLLVPLRSEEHRFGVLFLGSEVTDLVAPEAVAFGKTVGAQVAQSLELASTVKLLADSSSALADPTDFEKTLTKIARLAVPFLADWAIIEVIDQDGLSRSIGGAHSDPFKEELLRKLQICYPLDLESEQPAAVAFRTSEPQLFPDCTEPGLAAANGSPKRLELLRDLATKTGMALPLVARGKTLGVISFGCTTSARRYGPRDMVLAEEVARRAAIAIDNRVLYHQAEEAVRARDEFISAASHELKTPLTPLQLQLASALEVVHGGLDDGASSRLARKLEVADRQVERLVKLVGNLLDVTRIAHQRLDLQLEPVDLAAVVSEVATQFTSAADASGCSFTLKIKDSIIGNWDRMRLEQVVTNLISNAVKYGGGRPIEIRVEGDDKLALLSVRDHGIGIASEDQARIFQRFERAVSTHDFGGLGLGLWIVQHIVEALDGRIQVASELGKGATFTVELPRSPTSPAPRVENIGHDA